MNSRFVLGHGREVSSRNRWQRLVYTMPLWGEALEQAIWKPVPVSTEDADSPHLMVAAGTGKGKTLGIGLKIVFDALEQGSLMLLSGGGPLVPYFITECVTRNIPPQHVCLVDPSFRHTELGSPTTHLLQALPGRTEAEIAEHLVSDTALLAQRISSPGPRMNELGFNAFRLLQSENQPISELLTLMYQPSIRTAWVSRCKDRTVRMYWEWFDREYNENQKAIVLNVLGNKWSPLIRSPFTGPMVSSIDSTIDMRRIVNTKGMALVVELSEGRLGQDVSQTLAQAVLSRIKLEILQRAEIPEAQRVPCTILIDEYSLIKSPAVSVLYRLSRNLSCTVIVMLQDLSVFAEEELRAITGNSSLLVMGVGEKEGERLVLELFRPTGTKKKSWTEERYYSPNEEIYIAQDHLFDQEPQRAVALMKPTGLYFMKTPTRKPPVSDPEKELLYRAEIATHWYKKPLPDED